MDVYVNDTERDLTVKKSQISEAGLGVFTNVKITRGSIIGVYTGKIINPSSKIKNRDYLLHVNKRILIDASQTPRCIMAMVNSFDGSNFTQNCEFVFVKRGKNPIVQVIATSDIESGSELFISYGDSYFV